MFLQRSLALLVALVSLALPSSAVYGDPAHPARFTGMDGLTYEPSPSVVQGLDGQLFYGPDFDFACGVGARMKAAVDNLAKLAAVIERSGRRVVYTIGPNKSTALAGTVDPGTLPHGACDSLGLQQQRKILDTYPDRAYLPLRGRLATSNKQTYFKTDLHWTSVGGSIFAKALAKRLDPRVGRLQRYEYGTTTALGGLNATLHIDQPETSEAAQPDDHVHVRAAPTNSNGLDVVYDFAWSSTPPHRTLTGDTLLLGDSFMANALQNLQPIFRHGRFMWIGHVDLDKVARAIRSADTVVFEAVQVFITSYPIGTKAFRHHLRRELLGHDRKTR